MIYVKDYNCIEWCDTELNKQIDITKFVWTVTYRRASLKNEMLGLKETATMTISVSVKTGFEFLNDMD